MNLPSGEGTARITRSLSLIQSDLGAGACHFRCGFLDAMSRDTMVFALAQRPSPMSSRLPSAEYCGHHASSLNSPNWLTILPDSTSKNARCDLLSAGPLTTRSCLPLGE